ncbi:hypothetical protein [Pseudomonas putida]|uniref:hypothetical protein n=1 Tax=Pseudomonas putida TaxID=303 RepID=UPI00265842EB|nr:hypothetical protein [Pseudomonas putida]MCZ9636560.1 hypothetical protein [Pseudomonas putida]
MNALSVEAFLKKLAEEPRTFGFDAVLAFDRGMTNNLLMQEYIDRFDSKSYFPPLTSEIEVGEGTSWHQIRGFLLDKPRLSFENASIADSRATLTLRIVGGKQLQIDRPLGSTVKNLVRLAAANPLHGPSLIFDIDLKKVTGSVDSAGRVVLDLSQGTSYTFTGVDTNFERIKMGEHFQQVFEGWDDDQKVYQLNELKVESNDLIQPGDFVIRTHAAPGATSVLSEDFGKGAVLLFVSMKGREIGTPPISDAQLPYLLPDAPSPFSANLLLSHAYILEHVLLSKFNELEGLDRFKFELQNDARGRFKKLVATSGRFVMLPWYWEEQGHPNRRNSSAEISWMEFDSDSPFSFEMIEIGQSGKWQLLGTWHGTAEPLCTAFSGGMGNEGNLSAKAPVGVSWTWSQGFSFNVVEDEDGKHLVFRSLSEPSIEVEFDFPSEFMHSRLDSGRATIERYFRQTINFRLGSFTGPLSDMSFELDAFRLNSLLFRSDDVVELRESYWPGDLTLLGDLAPGRTGFAVAPQEKIVLADTSYTFTVQPHTADVKWSVANLPDEAGNPGTIDADTGEYQAPVVADLDGDFKRVVVTASAGNVTSKSLVSVVARDVSVYPMIVVVGFEGTYTVSASTVDGSPLSWAMADGSLGNLQPDPHPDPNVQDSRVYVAPDRAPDYEPDRPYHEYVVRMDQIQVSRPSAPAQPIDVLLPIATSSYWLEAEVAGESVQLRFYYKNTRNEILEVPTDQARWYVVKGDGEVAHGLFTPRPNSAQLYAVIVAMRNPEEEEDAYRFAYMIVPLPFVSANSFVALLQRSTEES